MEQDTIVAIATPPGRGGIGVLRVSGDESLAVLSALCPKRKRWPDRRAVVTDIVDHTGARLDETVVIYYRGPRSYTGEDMVEISCHGSPLILDRIVAEALARGCRAARPGEFTLRAFLSGRIDLTQAEAIVDLVEARTDAGLGLALRQLEGELSNRIEPLRSRLLDVLAHATALVDFSEDDIPELAVADVRQSLEGIRRDVDALIDGALTGAVLQHGVSLAIVGAPNVGKSSMLNALLGRSRAIVTPIAGTTRDTVEDEIQIDGILFRVMDTAGITTTVDVVESIGIERSREALSLADVVLVVLDASRPLHPDDLQALDAVGVLSTGPASPRSETENRSLGLGSSASGSRQHIAGDRASLYSSRGPADRQHAAVDLPSPDTSGEPAGRQHDALNQPSLYSSRGPASRQHIAGDLPSPDISRGPAERQHIAGDQPSPDTSRGVARHGVIVALNKSDLDPVVDAAKLPIHGDTRVISTTAVAAEGLLQLRQALPEIVLNGHATEGFTVSNARHSQSLTVASDALEHALGALDGGLPLDLVSLDMREALSAISAIIGIEVGDAVLDRVFSNFCIGK